MNKGIFNSVIIVAVLFVVQLTTATLQCTDLAGMTVNVHPSEKRNFDAIWVDTAIPIPAANGIPAYCQVTGRIDANLNQPAILKFQVRLPENWNRRFLHVGNGGNAGVLAYYGSYNQPFDFIGATDLELVVKGYAHAVNDLGTTTIYNSPSPDITEEKILFAYLGTHLATIVIKEIITTYYEQDILKSYFSGCSTGGFSALMEATLYPNDFDGIIAQDVVDGTIANAYQAGELVKANNLPGPNPFVDGAMLESAYNLAVAKCGDVDGIIRDSYRCDWDPVVDLASLNLDANQLNFFKKVYSNIEIDGIIVQYGFPPGCERDMNIWFANNPDTLQIFGTGSLAEGQLSFFQYFIYGNTSLTWDDISLDSFNDVNFDYDIYNIGTKFRRYLSTGNKLMLVSNGGSGIYSYANIVKTWSNRILKNPNSKAARNYRHYIVPNSGHCGIANNALGIVTNSQFTASFDPLEYMIDWVENGVEPTEVSAKVGVNQVQIDICPYPSIRIGNDCVDQPLLSL